MNEKPLPPPINVRCPGWWASMAEWLADERPMPESVRLDALACVRGIPVQRDLF
jgi:hypothetical protein